MKTKRIVLNISITVNKINKQWVQCAVFVTPLATLNFTLHKELTIFSKNPQVTSFAFRDSFLALRKLA